MTEREYAITVWLNAHHSAGRSLDCHPAYGEAMKEAATELTRLRAENEKLREALRPFAGAAPTVAGLDDRARARWPMPKSIPEYENVPVHSIDAGDLRRARAALDEQAPI